MAAGGRRRLIRGMAFGFGDDEDRWRRLQADQQHGRLQDAADVAERAVVEKFYELLVEERLVTIGSFKTPSAAPSIIRPQAWKFIRVRKWDTSVAQERTPDKCLWYDVQVFPALLAPNAVDLLAGSSLRDAFQRFVLDDPEVVSLRAPALKVAPHFSRLFMDGSHSVHCTAEEWPLHLAGRDLVGVVHPDRAKCSPFGYAGRPDPMVAVAAVDALLQRWTSLLDLLRRGDLVAEGLPSVARYPPIIPASVWSHDDFSLGVRTGNVFEFNPNSHDRYDRLIKRWSAVMLRRAPETARVEVSTGAVGDRSDRPTVDVAGRPAPNRRPHPRPKTDAVAEALRIRGRHQSRGNLTLKQVASIIVPLMPHPPRTKAELEALTKAVGRYYLSDRRARSQTK